MLTVPRHRRVGPLDALLVVSLFLAFFCWLLSGCNALPAPLQGGGQSASLGGGRAPTTVTVGAPDNPKTPTETSVKKTIVRDYFPSAHTQRSTTGGGVVLSAASENFLEPSAAASSSNGPCPAPTPSTAALAARSSGSGSTLSREVITEEASTRLGAAQADTARELRVRLSNMRGVMYVGIFLLFAGPIIGWKLGWLLNGCIAGAVGLGLVILATVLPGNEAWFGLFGLLLIPVVGFVYYKARDDSQRGSPPLDPAQGRAPAPDAARTQGAALHSEI